jgi:predicted transglutaminase-like cysteine proteinase
MQIISRYKLVIEVLRKRQEKFYLVLALRELGNLNQVLDNLPQAEEMWNDALDTIF